MVLWKHKVQLIHDSLEISGISIIPIGFWCVSAGTVTLGDFP